MAIEFGHFALILALAVACVQTGAVIYGDIRRDEQIKEISQTAAITQFLLLCLSFWGLTSAYIASDFSVANVALNSHSEKPLLYKISGVWGNHEGSMLLWVLILSVFGASVAIFGRNLPDRLRTNVLAVQGAIGIAFLAFVIFTSNPFIRIDPAPLQGHGLNPVLQDPALAFHPPLLYAGYVGLSMAFSFAIAALIEGRLSAAWARWVRPWTLAAWIFLTLGIATGSWWAYYELGWGGWWFWDPVENASFMPWLAATALLHSAIVMEKREALKAWTILLAIIAFALSLLGTFIVRSGLLTSVHAFASDPTRGVFVLLILAFFTGGAFALFAWRAPVLRRGGVFAPVSRESTLLLNNLLLMVSCGAVLTGTLFPMVLDMAAGIKMSVGAPYFNWVFGLLMVPLLIVLPLGPFLAWKRGDIRAAGVRTLPAMIVAVLAMISVALTAESSFAAAPVGFGLGVWVIIGALSELGFRAKITQSPGEFLRRLRHLPRANYGTAFAHIGVGITVIGIIGTMAWKAERVLTMKTGESVYFLQYDVKFERAGVTQGPNYVERFGEFIVTQNGKPVTTLMSGKRAFSSSGMPTTETGILATWTGDLYLSLGDFTTDGTSVAVHIQFHPLVRLIWLGALFMVFGGGLSLLDRRLRVGAPVRGRKVQDIAATSSAGQPT